MTTRVHVGVQQRLTVSDPSDVGECRRSAKRLADGFNFDEVSAGRVSIVVTELATNLLRYAPGGEVLLQVLDNGERQEFEVLAVDRGPGMKDVEACLRDGFSTGGTAGQGLGAVSRLSKKFDLYSVVGQGTAVLSRIARTAEQRLAERVAPSLEIGAICLAVAGEIECGDIWRIAEDGPELALFVADGLGHGPLAAAAARAGATAFATAPFDDPSACMQRLHRALGGTRGAAAACARLHAAELRLDYAGVGNVAGRVVSAGRSRGMVSHNGTLGVQLLRSQKFDYDLPVGGRIIMHSDGLSARWSLDTYPGLHMRHSAVIAAVLYRDFARQRDDATVVVVGLRP